MFTFLEKELKKYRIIPQRRKDDELYYELCQNPTYRKEIESFYGMLQTFLSLHKNGLYSDEDIKKRLVSEDIYAAKRNALFLKIYQRIYQAYGSFLYKTHRYDFADMINSAEECVREIPECACGYKYILLDEVQDLSRNRFMLVRAILRKNPGCKLFAVGDDWQSIYRFTGSDLGLIHGFEKTFGLTTRRSLIESTHRFGQPTIRISCDFIQRNPLQSHKLVRNIQKSNTPIYVILNKPTKNTEGQDAESLRAILRAITDKHGSEVAKTKSIQIISRYNHDINRIKSDDFQITAKDDGGEVFEIYWQDFRLEFCSMHKSKGITRDIVIVLNMNSDLMGMPATRESDPIIDALLAEDDSYPFAEERRLFYVAITRAREATYLIANRKNPSPFIFEISDSIKEAYGKLCPKCHTGELIKKHGRFGDFFYCSNYAYGCDYLKKI
ncbi:UvrD-helicase domain-containing protein [Candidatus Saccharibacteria bacterium]|nr:UvrD-helicase domain-containing protein [Candidatus Saccharibacteria bacterium]